MEDERKSSDQRQINGKAVGIFLAVALGLWLLFMYLQGVWPPWTPH